MSSIDLGPDWDWVGAWQLAVINLLHRCFIINERKTSCLAIRFSVWSVSLHYTAFALWFHKVLVLVFVSVVNLNHLIHLIGFNWFKLNIIRSKPVIKIFFFFFDFKNRFSGILFNDTVHRYVISYDRILGFLYLERKQLLI